MIQRFGSVANHPVLGPSASAKRACSVAACGRGIKTFECIVAMKDTCAVIHLGGSGGIIEFMEHQRYTHDFFRVFGPAPYLRDAADRWLAQ